MGKRVRDIVTAREGIVTGVMRWVTGYDSLICEEGVTGKIWVFEFTRAEIVDDGISDRIEADLFLDIEPYFNNLGKKAKDKITGFSGIVIGLCNNAFRSPQYVVQGPYENGKSGAAEYMDVSRLIFDDEEPAVSPEDLSNPKRGGFAFQPQINSFI